ncbi:MAG: hypothetical protein Q9166_003022 [cf. Caloplaca sp. 2 TL-2023]
MPTAISPPKFVLRPSAVSQRDSPTPSHLSREGRNRQLALHHARLIQYRKDIESLILASTETLLEIPTSPTASPSEPPTTDMQTVKEALRPFQPSDYDAFIEERNINNKCGYVLCPRENRRQNKVSRYRIITGRDFKVVEAKELEKWCSDECGKMALYLRVQLSEEPAWSRDWQTGEALELYGEGAHGIELPDPDGPVSQVSMKSGLSGDNQTLALRMKSLAVERGDKENTAKASTRVAVDVKENIHGEQITPVVPSTENTYADSIEGYIPINKYLLKSNDS